MKKIAKLFWLDDRTGKPSTSKLIRWLTWVLAAQFVIVCQVMIFTYLIEITQERIQCSNYL